MKRSGIVVCVLAAFAAGFIGSSLRDLLGDPEPVHAANEIPIKIAVLDLIKASRKSKKFTELKLKWEEALDAVTKKNKRQKEALASLMEKLRTARSDGESPDRIMMVEVDIKASRQKIKASEAEQKDYLVALRYYYQKEVLIEVMGEAEQICRTQKFKLLLQDFTLEESADDFFESGAWAAQLLQKPVLYAPGMGPEAVGKFRNSHVVDITEQVIQAVNSK